MSWFRSIAPSALAILTVAVPGAALAELSSEDALAVATEQWFEGVPESALDTLAPDAIDALVSLLEDPTQEEHHSTAIEILGRTGAKRATPDIQRYVMPRVSAEEEVSVPVHRARMAAVIALGRLGRDHGAAYEALRRVMRDDVPRWRTPRMNQSRVERIYRDLCVLALAETGRPEAEQEIRRSRGHGDAETWNRRVQDALALHRTNMRSRNGRER